MIDFIKHNPNSVKKAVSDTNKHESFLKQLDITAYLNTTNQKKNMVQLMIIALNIKVILMKI